MVVIETPSFPVRLIATGFSSVEGRLEVFHKEWGTVCDGDWDLQDAHVVCRQLGLGRAIEAFAGLNRDYGSGEQLILLSRLRCNGSEQVLAQCLSDNGLRRRGCRNRETVALICEGEAHQNVISMCDCNLFRWSMSHCQSDGQYVVDDSVRNSRKRYRDSVGLFL